jgi:hypothetical protein
MIPVAQWERLAELVDTKQGTQYYCAQVCPSEILLESKLGTYAMLTDTQLDPQEQLTAWGVGLLLQLGVYCHFNRTAIIIGRKSSFLRKSFSYDAQGNIAPALMLALLAALEAAPDLQEKPL